MLKRTIAKLVTQVKEFVMAFGANLSLPSAAQALPGRAEVMLVPDHHFVSGRPMQPPFPQGLAQVCG